MKPIKIRKPSPAIIVAVLALVAALAGTAIAGPSANDSGAAKKAKKALKIAKKNKKAIKNIELTPGPEGPQGSQGPPGADGTARAFAHILGDGTLVAADSQSVSTAKNGTGEYCLRTEFDPKNIVATTSPNDSYARGDLGLLGSCSMLLPGANAFVITEAASDGVTNKDAEFFVLIN